MARKNTQLRAYMFYQFEPGEEAYLIFARTSREAKIFGLSYGLLEDYDPNLFCDVKADRHKRADGQLISGSTETYHEERPTVLREAGWHWEGDIVCEKCDLYEMDGVFPVCSQCDQCSKCGHTEGCSNA